MSTALPQTHGELLLLALKLNLEQQEAKVAALKAQVRRKHEEHEALEQQLAALRGAYAGPEGKREKL